MEYIRAVPVNICFEAVGVRNNFVYGKKICTTMIFFISICISIEKYFFTNDYNDCCMQQKNQNGKNTIFTILMCKFDNKTAIPPPYAHCPHLRPWSSIAKIDFLDKTFWTFSLKYLLKRKFWHVGKKKY